MIPELATIPFSEVPPHSLVIIRAHEDVADEMISTFRAKIPSSASILIARRETDVFCITEDVLNQAGWRYRSP